MQLVVYKAAVVSMIFAVDEPWVVTDFDSLSLSKLRRFGQGLGFRTSVAVSS